MYRNAAKITKILFLFFSGVLAQLNEYDTCLDGLTRGECCPLHACGSAVADLRAQRRPVVCYYDGFLPAVCCKSPCMSENRNPITQISNNGDISPNIGELSPKSGAQDPNFSGLTIDVVNPTEYVEGSSSQDGGPRIKIGGPASQPIVRRRRSEEMCDRYHETEQRSKRSYDYDYYDGSETHADTTTSGGHSAPHQIDASQSTPKPATTTSNRYFLVGGTDVHLAEFPHMAAVGWPLRTGGVAFKCGGSLISDRFVLTAGHCLSLGRDSSVSSAEPSLVRLGDQNILDNVLDGAKPMDVPILRSVRHPNYKSPIQYYDIALLELGNRVAFSFHVRPACLWTEQTFGSHRSAIVTGWGTTVSGGRENSAVLQKVNVDILDTEVCQPLLQSARNRNWQGFSDHQLCAGVLAGGRDACQGDSGGPLQLKTQERYHVIGITSFGRECARANQPGVYTRVSAFLDWIEAIVWP